MRSGSPVASNSIHSGITISTVKKATGLAVQRSERRPAGRPIREESEGRGKVKARSVRRREGGEQPLQASQQKGRRACTPGGGGRPPGPRPPRLMLSCMHACMNAPSAGPAGRMGNSTSSRPQAGSLLARRETMLVRGVRPSRIRPRHFSFYPPVPCPSPNRARGFYSSCVLPLPPSKRGKERRS